MNDNNNGGNSGHVRVYEWDETSRRWEQRGEDIYGEAAGDQSGWSLSLSSDGTVLAIGAIRNDGVNASDSGHVRVYHWHGVDNKSWVQRGSDIDGEAAGDQSGYSVSLSSDGTIVAIGANLNDGVNGYDSGHVRVYKWNNIDRIWVQRGQDIDGEAAGDQSGYSVSLSSDGTVLAIGAYRNDGVNGENRVMCEYTNGMVNRGCNVVRI